MNSGKFPVKFNFQVYINSSSKKQNKIRKNQPKKNPNKKTQQT